MRKTVEERLWPKIEIVELTDCWPWKAAISRGYGRFNIDGKTFLAHRLAFEFYWGVSLPRWLQVCHNCPGGDNTACCNPMHMLIADHKWHAKDTKSKGQYATGDRNGARLYPERNMFISHPERNLRGVDHPKAKLTEAQVLTIHRRCKNGDSQRVVAREYKVSQMNVWMIVNERIWKHLWEGTDNSNLHL